MLKPYASVTLSTIHKFGSLPFGHNVAGTQMESVEATHAPVPTEAPTEEVTEEIAEPTPEEAEAEAEAVEKAQELLDEKKEDAISAASYFFMCEDKVKILKSNVEGLEAKLFDASEILRKMKSDDEEIEIKIDEDADEFTPERAFAVFDADDSGGIDKNELKNAIAAVNDKIVGDDEIAQVMSKYDLNEDGQLTLDEFRKLCKSKKLNLKKRRTSIFKKSVVQNSETDAAAVSAIKEELIHKEIIAKAEKQVDEAEAKLVETKKELQEAEATLAVAAEEDEKAKEEAKRQEKVLDDIKEGAWGAERIFAAFDADKNGTLDVSELELALTALLGLKVSEATAKKFAEKYDTDNDGNLDFQEWSKCSAEAKKSPAAFFNNIFSFGNADAVREKVEEMEKGKVVEDAE